MDEPPPPPTDALLLNNDAWLDGLKYIDFLRDVGRHFTINKMLTMDSVKLRLEREQPLTFLEFNYMILQAYDFVELNRRHGCTLRWRTRQCHHACRRIDLEILDLGAIYGDKASLVAFCSPAAIKAGHAAGKIVQTITAKIGGKGGGKPDFAMGGGKDIGKLAEIMSA